MAESALPIARSLAERFGGELHLVSVVSSILPVTVLEGNTGRVKGWFSEGRAMAQAYLSNLKDHLDQESPSIPTHLRVLTGDPASAVADRARRIQADLVVMNTHGRGPVKRFWLGSVADGLIRRGPCPILLRRPGGQDAESRDSPDPPDIQRILVPLDGSQRAESILPRVAALARAYEARIYLVSVLPASFPPLASAFMPPGTEAPDDRDMRLEELESYLDGVRDRFSEGGFQVEVQVLDGVDPAEMILVYRARIRADMVAISTRGRGGVARMVLGSVADKVIRAGEVPVLVHRAPEHDD